MPLLRHMLIASIANYPLQETACRGISNTKSLLSDHAKRIASGSARGVAIARSHVTRRHHNLYLTPYECARAASDTAAAVLAFQTLLFVAWPLVSIVVQDEATVRTALAIPLSAIVYQCVLSVWRHTDLDISITSAVQVARGNLGSETFRALLRAWVCWTACGTTVGWFVSVLGSLSEYTHFRFYHGTGREQAGSAWASALFCAALFMPPLSGVVGAFLAVSTAVQLVTYDFFVLVAATQQWKSATDCNGTRMRRTFGKATGFGCTPTTTTTAPNAQSEQTTTAGESTFLLTKQESHNDKNGDGSMYAGEAAEKYD